MLTDQARRLVDRPEFGVLSSTNPDGTHHLCVMWVGRRDGDIVMASRSARRQVQNLLRHPAASLLVHSRVDPLEYVEIRGEVEVGVDEGGELVDSLARAYTGSGHVGLDPEADTDRVILRLQPSRVIDHPRRS